MSGREDVFDGPTRARPAPTVVRHTKVRIGVTRGPDAGASVESAGEIVRVGTAPDNDLVLRDDSVSRHHCELEPTPHGVRVRDAGSTNGVLLGSARVRDATVPGDFQIGLGESWLAIQWLSETVDREELAVDGFGDVIGRSRRMRELFALLERIAPTDCTVLIEGETGTGKELVAESLHGASARAEGPFVIFDCGAVSPTLVESELFGHEKGSFTGAVGTHVGVFEQAHGGTLFLDEIGELGLELQPKLLRALDKREVRRVGGSATIAVDVRIVAATNRNLRAELGRGFREDLYYRLAGARVHLPPLRDRIDDLEPLVESFLAELDPPRALHELPEDVIEMLRAHRWPGNVRELRNAVQRLAVLPERPFDGATGVTPTPIQKPSGPALRGAAPEKPPAVVPLREARRRSSDDFERAYVAELLGHTGGNVTRAAALAEISRQMMQKLMRKHGFGGGR
jgi:DNA-binding NtrC family response regulator